MVHIREKGGQAIAVCRLIVYKDSSLPNICYYAQGEGEREGEEEGEGEGEGEGDGEGEVLHAFYLHATLSCNPANMHSRHKLHETLTATCLSLHFLQGACKGEPGKVMAISNLRSLSSHPSNVPESVLPLLFFKGTSCKHNWKKKLQAQVIPILRKQTCSCIARSTTKAESQFSFHP